MASPQTLAGGDSAGAPEPGNSAAKEDVSGSGSVEARGVTVKVLPRVEPVRSFTLPEGVKVDVYVEGDKKTFPKDYVQANVTGRLPSGCVFEGNLAKGRPPMRLELGKRAVVPGMELALRALTLGARAELRMPPKLGYRDMGIPKLVPPNSDLIFEVDILVADGQTAPPKASAAEASSGSSSDKAGSDDSVFKHPWWLARVERPPPSGYYLSFCRLLARGLSVLDLARSRPISRKTREEVSGWDLSGSPLIVGNVQDDWRASKEWTWEWLREHLGDQRQMVKWQGPVFTKQEALWDNPVWETSVAEYIDYVRSVDAADPNCEEQNAAACPRLYLNGWPVFSSVPFTREYVVNPMFIDDITGAILAEHEELQEGFITGLSAASTSVAQPKAVRQKNMEDSFWEMTKLFLSPKGSLTRLHYDNGGAHAWLSQVRGRKLFVCFDPKDGPNLHPFLGDEGFENGSWIDPLDDNVLERWPDYKRATPYVGVVEEGETIFCPQGWWHYAVAMDASVTVMRNFYTSNNRHELDKRKDELLEKAVISSVLARQMARATDEKRKEAAQKLIQAVRHRMFVKGNMPRPGPVSLPTPTGSAA